jgi:peptide/nickel transport system permease protein
MNASHIGATGEQRNVAGLAQNRSSLGYRVKSTARSLRRSPVGMVGFSIVAVVLFLAAFGPWVSPFDPRERNLQHRFEPPGTTIDGRTYLLGTDHMGRDMVSRLIAGARVSVVVGLITVLIAGTVGVLYGVLSGYGPTWLDHILMRIVDALLAIPFLILVIAIAGVLGAGLTTLILVLAATGWVTYARVTRSEVFVVRGLDFIMAARAIGQTHLIVMLRHVLPNVLTSGIVLAAINVATVILAETALSFLGLGVQPPTITWGLMLADGRSYIGSAWWLATFPGIAITITVLGVVFLGDWLRDVLDPRLQGE